ncbi:MAG: L-histidine N(alpha)-methyltransferase, partial [Saprospiraceae bacterium]
SLSDPSFGRKVVLFLGSNIGNFEPADAERFLAALADKLNPNDLLLVGVDLKKDPQTILDAYNDAAGITEAFNLNLLTRINRELGGNFVVENFKHWETYNPLTGATRSHIISKKDQQVSIEALGATYQFAAWEAIDVELSQKYNLVELEKLAEQTGFQVACHFTDARTYFVDSLWRKV